jgi:hypothetical protein
MPQEKAKYIILLHFSCLPFFHRILYLQESGILQTFKQKHWPIAENCRGTVVTEAKEIKLIDVQAVFIVTGVGIVSGAIVLLIEKVLKKHSQNA